MTSTSEAFVRYACPKARRINPAKIQGLWDFPGGRVVKTAYFQCRVRGFSLWLGNSDLMCGMTENEKLKKGPFFLTPLQARPG